MRTSDRKIIFKCVIGSRLYGTNDAESDEDYCGVFLPGTEDLFGLQNCPTEWTFNEKKSDTARNQAGDVDCKLYSIQEWMRLALKGEPQQLELLFIPEDKILIKEPEWDAVLRNKDFFLSKRGISPFIGFALSQAHKATIKGDNLNRLRAIKAWGSGLTPQQRNIPIAFHVLTSDDGQFSSVGGVADLERITNEHGFTNYVIAGRKYDVNLKTKTFLENIDGLISKYGSRSETAAAEGHDWKNLCNAYRLIGEAKEFLSTGKISFPRPDAEWLYQIKKGKYDGDHFGYITEQLDLIRQQLEPASTLPDQPRRDLANKLCIELLYHGIVYENF